MPDADDPIRHLLDRQAISECVHRYARGIDRGDVDLVASCYWPDAVDHHGSYVGSGRGLAEWAIESQGRASVRSQNHITTHTVDLDGDTAHGETYFLVVARRASGGVNVATGRYVDRFERRHGEWRLAARQCLVESLAEAGAVDTERLDGAYAGARDLSDPSYTRPLVLSDPDAGR